MGRGEVSEDYAGAGLINRTIVNRVIVDQAIGVCLDKANTLIRPCGKHDCQKKLF
jgi:hypothetical protein